MNPQKDPINPAGPDPAPTNPVSGAPLGGDSTIATQNNNLPSQEPPTATGSIDSAAGEVIGQTSQTGPLSSDQLATAGSTASLGTPSTPSSLTSDLPIGSQSGIEGESKVTTIKDTKTDDDEEEGEDDEPEVVERVIIKEKGGLGCFSAIRRLTCFCLLVFLLLVAAILALIIFKPPFLTEPLKKFLNDDYKPAEVSAGITEESVDGFINEVTSPQAGEVTFQLTEDQLTTLVRARLTDGADVRVGLEENKIQIFTDVAQQGEPLWVIVELADTDDKLVFSRIGFGRINAPASVRDFVKDRAFGFLGSVIKDLKLETSEQLVSSLVGGEIESGVTIKNVKFAKDLVLVTVEL